MIDNWDKLEAGVTSWNRWRQTDPETIPQLWKRDLRRTDLRGIDLRWSVVSRSNLRGSNLQGAKLLGATLRDCNLRDCDLRGPICQEQSSQVLTSLVRGWKGQISMGPI